MARRTLLALILMLGLAPMVFAQTASDPAAYVRTIYASYEQNKPAPWYSLNYTPRPRALIQADRKKAKGEVGAFDFDSIVSAQDFELGAVRVGLPQQGDAAVVNVAFHIS